MFELSVEDTFAAGHALRGYRGKCEKVHGHNYKVLVTIEGQELDPAGLLLDFSDVKSLLRAVMERLDHEFLNDVPPFDALNPSAENMAQYFFEEIGKGLPAGRASVASVKVWETDTSSATYRP